MQPVDDKSILVVVFGLCLLQNPPYLIVSLSQKCSVGLGVGWLYGCTDAGKAQGSTDKLAVFFRPFPSEFPELFRIRALPPAKPHAVARTSQLDAGLTLVIQAKYATAPPYQYTGQHNAVPGFPRGP